ncbi:ribonuclease HI [Rhizobium sp. KVB221]|uniref:ribonuclease H n=1 Tax=Rhizobium setariae TaxID=2801340 RepID=A0A937CQ60_9HYPH|nr:ribonuclease H [Rhizobium setariae]MBL0374019.1 ribonuclease HI [Rhizobium setariae]
MKPARNFNPKPKPDYLTSFTPSIVLSGHHVFADGACVPNPGPGGWGIVAYLDGQEIYSDNGGDKDATNNTMELTAVLQAIRWATQYPALAITIWSDSQYVVKGVNEWRHGWKRNGWKRGGPNATEKNQSLANAAVWVAIDEALTIRRAANISVAWVKGHSGAIGNERADELAEMGRQSITEADMPIETDLDVQYRAI